MTSERKKLSSPAPTPGAVDSLIQFLRLSQGFALIIVVSEFDSICGNLAAVLQVELSDTLVTEVDVARDEWRDVVHALLDRAALNSGQARDVIYLCHGIDSAVGPNADIAEPFRIFNEQRDVVAGRLNAPVVLILKASQALALQRAAPDLWSIRTTVLRLESDGTFPSLDEFRWLEGPNVYLQRLRRIGQVSDSDFLRASTYGKLGLAYVRIGQISRAERAINRGLELATSIPDELTESSLLLARARVRLRRDNTVGAFQDAKRAGAIAEKHGASELCRVSKQLERGAMRMAGNFRGRDADVPGTEMSRIDLAGTDLNGIVLAQRNLSYARLERTNLSGCNLTGADLSNAFMRSANLFKANLTDAILIGSDLQCADLTQARLDGAYLRGANLSGANLVAADFNEADLRETNLTGARLGSCLCRPQTVAVDSVGRVLFGGHHFGGWVLDLESHTLLDAYGEDDYGWSADRAVSSDGKYLLQISRHQMRLGRVYLQERKVTWLTTRMDEVECPGVTWDAVGEFVVVEAGRCIRIRPNAGAFRESTSQDEIRGQIRLEVDPFGEEVAELREEMELLRAVGQEFLDDKVEPNELFEVFRSGHSLAISPSFLVMGGSKLAVWDRRERRIIKRIDQRAQLGEVVCISPDGRWLSVANRTGLHIFAADTWIERSHAVGNADMCQHAWTSRADCVAVLFHGVGASIFSVSDDGSLRHARTIRLRMPAHGITFVGANRVAISGNFAVLEFEIESGELVAAIPHVPMARGAQFQGARGLSRDAKYSLRQIGALL